MSLLLTIASGNKRLVTETFYANATWVCPATTFRLESITGKGTDGSPGSSYASSTGPAFLGNYITSGTGTNSGAGTWDQLMAYAQAAFNSINAGGATSCTTYTVAHYPNPSSTYSIVPGGVVNFGGSTVAGSAFFTYGGGAAASGIISSIGTITINFQIGTGATNGSSSNGFGQIFPGGVGGAAGPVTYVSPTTNLATVPGNSYNMTIFSGGYITISYLR